MSLLVGCVAVAVTFVFAYGLGRRHGANDARRSDWSAGVDWGGGPVVVRPKTVDKRAN